jgi:hypothetical protein
LLVDTGILNAGGVPQALSGMEFFCMYVTRHSEITDQRLHDDLWTLYRRAYGPVARMSPTHEMLDRDEFSDQLRSSNNRVWVVWDDSRPVGMALITTDVRATRWLNEDFFADQYPDRFREGRVHYVVWVTIDPSHAGRGALMVLARQALSVESRDGALLVFDTPEIHQEDDQGGAAALMLRMAQMVGEAQLIPLTTQRYYAVDFAPVPGLNESNAVEMSDKSASL